MISSLWFYTVSGKQKVVGHEVFPSIPINKGNDISILFIKFLSHQCVRGHGSDDRGPFHTSQRTTSTATRVKVPTVIMSRNINFFSLKVFHVTSHTSVLSNSYARKIRPSNLDQKIPEVVVLKEEKVKTSGRYSFTSFL
jgi:hypothetical protein